MRLLQRLPEEGLITKPNSQFTGLMRSGECGEPMWMYQNGPRDIPNRRIWRCGAAKADHYAITHIDVLRVIGEALQETLRELDLKMPDLPNNDHDHLQRLEKLLRRRARMEGFHWI